MWSITCPWPMRRPPRAFGSRYGALVIDSMPPATMAAAPSSGAAKLFSSPWNAAIGVRAAETMTMGSLCMVRSSDSESGRQIVRAHQGAAALQHLRGQGTGLARLGIHRNAGEDADGRDFAALRVAHLVHEARDLLPRLEERGAHRAAIGFDQLGAHALSAKSSRPISQRRISEVPAPIS